jgi:hypothetical protein
MNNRVTAYLDLFKYGVYFLFWIFLRPGANDFGHNMNQNLVYYIGLETDARNGEIKLLSP